MITFKNALIIIFCVLIVITCAQRCRPLADSSCSEPSDPGITGPGCFPCTRWSYDPSSKRCSAFTFQGCGGNRNRYCSRALCEKKCSSL